MAKATSANEVLHNTTKDHNWTHSPEDLTSTGGIQRAIKAQWHALQALADYIDGVATGETDDEGKPIKASDSSDDKSPPVSPPAAQPVPASPAPVA